MWRTIFFSISAVTNDIDMDWENGVFTDNFRGVWGSIDGNLCYMEIVYEGDDYNLYSVPVKLNGEDYHLRVVYDYSAEDLPSSAPEKASMTTACPTGI